MKILIVGLGIQGKKRIKYLKKKEYFASYDIFNKKADYSLLSSVPLNKFDSVFLCVPDNQKYDLVKFFLINKKNVFVEKPLFFDLKSINYLYRISIKNKCILYSAYNHRFEPNIIKLKKDLNLHKSKIYNIRLFYGNGTAKNVKKSNWRDKGLGVISDLAPHLIDTLIYTLGFKKISKIKIIKLSNFENNSPDHSIISFYFDKIFIELEVSLCSWKNNFKYDVYGRYNSFHIDSLFKWGNGSYLKYNRTLPSGKPKMFISKKNKTRDLSWSHEHSYLSNNISNLNLNKNSHERDKLISIFLNKVKNLIN